MNKSKRRTRGGKRELFRRHALRPAFETLEERAVLAVAFNPLGQFLGVSGSSSELSNPTSLQFGPDDRLYVAQQNGEVKAFEVGIVDGQYAALSEEILQNASGAGIAKSIQNHNDDGSLAGTIKRQVTGLLVTGTSQAPVIYVSSSDPRIAQGGEKNLDTNSGIITRAVWHGDGWDVVDIVRGLPRSEENHSNNGLALSPDGSKLYVAVGGHTNNGAPSLFFSYTAEYALSGAILEIDLADIDSRPVQIDADGGQGGQPRKYVYDLPTLDDPTVPNDGVQEDENGMDVDGPWGGNDGLNMAILPADAPLRIYADGFRNNYDLIFAESGKMYTVDNGSNTNLGADPVFVDGEVTNLPNDGGVGDSEPLFIVEDGAFYGHPNPTRSNQDMAWTVYDDTGDPDALVTPNSVVDISALVPSSVQVAEGFLIDPSKFTGDEARLIESGVRVPFNSPDSSSLVNIGSSSNGLVEYTADAFGGELKGDLLVAQFNGNVGRLNLNEDGTQASYETIDGLTGLSTPLDVTVGPNGTVWVAEIGGDFIRVFEPADSSSQNPDFDGDGLLNPVDPFIRDATNGGSVVVLPGSELLWDFDADQDDNLPGPNGYGGGLTGVMVNGVTDFEQFFQEPSAVPGQNVNLDNVKFITAAGGGTTVVENVSNGYASGQQNDGEFLFHTGFELSPAVTNFKVNWSVFNPGTSLVAGDGGLTGSAQQVGGYLGTGEQSNFLKFVAIAGADHEFELVLEDGDTVLIGQTFSAPGVFDVNPDEGKRIFFELEIDVPAGTATPMVSYETDLGTESIQGTAIALAGSAVLDSIRGQYQVQQKSTGVAVGLFSTNVGQPGGVDAFQAIFDDITISAEDSSEPTVLYRVNAGGPALAASDGGLDWSGDTLANNSIYLSSAGSNSVSEEPATVAGLSVPASTPVEVFHSERWDQPTDPSMSWAFDVPSEGDYEVRLYMANSFFGTQLPGRRIFDVSLEGQVLANLDDIDLSAQFGHQVGGMISNIVPVSDGTINIEFLHVVQNPLINGIEILQVGSESPAVVSIISGSPSVTEDVGSVQVSLQSDVPIPDSETVSVSFEIVPGTASAIEDYAYSSTTATYDSTTGIYTDSVVIAGGSSDATFFIDILDDSLDEPDESFTVNLLSVSSNAQLGEANATITVTDNDDVSEAVVLYRVNAGGPTVAASDGGLNWSGDTIAKNSIYLTSPGSNNVAGNLAVVAGPSVPSTTPAAVFAKERWDKPTVPSMTWAFDVPSAGDYEVRLYMANGFSGTQEPGQRVFDVALEGQIPANLDDIDLSAQFGHEVGGMISNIVPVSDGTINIEFLHVVQNPLINGIEILQVGSESPAVVSIISGSPSVTEDVGSVQVSLQSDVPIPDSETVSVSFEIVPGTASAIEDYAYSSTTATYDSTTGIYTDSVVIAGGSSDATFFIDILDDSLDEPDESFTVNLLSVSSNAQLGEANATITVTDNDDVSEAVVLYRVNAGGPTVAASDGGLNWSGDTIAKNSIYLTSPGSNNVAGNLAVVAGPSVPSTTPAAVFAKERWDKPTVPSMTWAFDVPSAGDYEVRLYMANGFSGTQEPGQRVFDVALEGQIPANLDDIDLSAQFGHEVGGMISNIVPVSDGAINIEFLHVVQNPLINAIEIIQVSQATQADPSGLSGEAVLSITENINNVQTSNYGSGSFVLRNTGEKRITAFELNKDGSLYEDVVFDPFGLAGDTVSKPMTIDTTGNSGVVTPTTQTYLGSGGSAGYSGIRLEFAESVDGGFQPGEVVTFSIDMDSNSIAGSEKQILNAGTEPNWDTGGVSGAEMIGSTFTVTFADGTTASGQIMGVGNQGGARGVAREGMTMPAPDLFINGVGPGETGTYDQNGASVVVNGPAGTTARVVLTKGFIQPFTNEFYNGDAEDQAFAPTLDAQLASLAATDFPANNAVEFQTVEVVLNGSQQDISTLFNFSEVGLFDFSGESQLPLGFVVSLIDPLNDGLPDSHVSRPIYLSYVETTESFSTAVPLVSNLDVNNDSEVSPLDALITLNAINQKGIEFGKGQQRSVAVDVNRDGYLSALDALLIINFLNNSQQSSGEGEAVDVFFGDLEERDEDFFRFDLPNVYH